VLLLLVIVYDFSSKDLYVEQLTTGCCWLCTAFFF